MLNKIRRKVTDNQAVRQAVQKDILLGLPVITIVGTSEMTVESFKGIVEYNDDCIRIKTSAGILKIEGKKLLLKQVTSETINISGVIKKIEYL